MGILGHPRDTAQLSPDGWKWYRHFLNHLLLIPIITQSVCGSVTPVTGSRTKQTLHTSPANVSFPAVAAFPGLWKIWQQPEKNLKKLKLNCETWKSVIGRRHCSGRPLCVLSKGASWHGDGNLPTWKSSAAVMQNKPGSADGAWQWESFRFESRNFCNEYNLDDSGGKKKKNQDDFC